MDSTKIMESPNTYHCFRCGHSTEDGVEYIVSECPSCGERGLLDVTTALDMLNDLYLRGELNLNEDEYEEIDDNTCNW